MDAKTYPLADILKPERRYVIPTFQRDYEWTKDGQWQLFFEDLDATAERLLQRREYAKVAGAATDEATVSPHFLGAIVCDSLPFPAGGVAIRAVIDGQQRLTTIQLLVRGLLDAVAEKNVDGVLRKEAASLRRMLLNPDDVAEVPEDVFKLWPRRLDRKVWPVVMADTVPMYGSGDHLYLQARKFFASAALESTNGLASGDALDRIRAMVDAVSGLFKLVVIDLDQNDDAQVIFEVLNGRQTPLSASDLVKNLLFLRGELTDPADIERLYDEYWANFDAPWWKVNVGTGHAQRGRRDVLLSVWLTAATGAEVSVGHLYREVRTYLDATRPKTEELLAELKSFARAYREVYSDLPVADGTLRRAYDRLIALGNLTAVPLLTWLRTLGQAQLSAEDHRRAVAAIESFTVRRVVAGWNSRGYGATFVQVLAAGKKASAVGENIADAVVHALAMAANTWPADGDVKIAFKTQNFYALSQARQRLILSAIDVRLREENPKEPPASFQYDRLQVEHVLPQTWEAHWPLSDQVPESDRAGVTQRRDVLKNTVGNLTLVTGTFNNGVKNFGWHVKRSEFQQQVSILLNKEVADHDIWDEAAIEARAEHLAEVAIRIWPDATALGHLPVGD
jgi:hypothetical protein